MKKCINLRNHTNSITSWKQRPSGCWHLLLQKYRKETFSLRGVCQHRKICITNIQDTYMAKDHNMNVLTGSLFILVVACSAGIELNRLNKYKITGLSRHKREDQCAPEYYLEGGHCCKPCSAGTYAQSPCAENYGKSNCEPCTDGQDYMDLPNIYSKCIRCGICDTGHGLETHSRCTITKNIQCKCQVGYFCNNTEATSGSCSKCLPCTKCDRGVQEPCTVKKDAVCKVLVDRHHHLILGSILFAVIGFLLMLWYLCNQKKRKRENDNIRPEEGESNPEVPLRENYDIRPEEGESNPGVPLLTFSAQGDANVSLCPPELEDINLMPELQYFAVTMNYVETKCFARKTISNTAIIEDIEYIQNNNDKKYELLKAWYQDNGQKGAFKKLLDTLVESGRRVTAEQLLKNLKERLIKKQANDI
uniref:Tumor necrosis factor receptor superfamily member 6 n=1 Tax=Leptobrachium leishanense TaxID=445787 RepID=A0A8C5MW31_9ANUR